MPYNNQSNNEPRKLTTSQPSLNREGYREYKTYKEKQDKEQEKKRKKQQKEDDKRFKSQVILEPRIPGYHAIFLTKSERGITNPPKPKHMTMVDIFKSWDGEEWLNQKYLTKMVNHNRFLNVMAVAFIGFVATMGYIGLNKDSLFIQNAFRQSFGVGISNAPLIGNFSSPNGSSTSSSSSSMHRGTSYEVAVIETPNTKSHKLKLNATSSPKSTQAKQASNTKINTDTNLDSNGNKTKKFEQITIDMTPIEEQGKSNK